MFVVLALEVKVAILSLILALLDLDMMDPLEDLLVVVLFGVLALQVKSAILFLILAL